MGRFLGHDEVVLVELERLGVVSVGLDFLDLGDQVLVEEDL